MTSSSKQGPMISSLPTSKKHLKYQEIQMEAKPHQVRVWRPVREATRHHRKQPGNRSQPDQDQCYQIHEATQMQEGSDEAYRVHGGPEPVYQPTQRQRPALLQTSQEVGQVLVERRSCRSLSAAQRLPHNSTHPHSSRRWGDSTPLHRSNHPCG